MENGNFDPEFPLEESKPEYVEGCVIVKFKDGVAEEKALELVRSWGATA